MATISRRMVFYLRRLVRRVIQSNDSSRQIAGGIAIGVFIAFTPTIGFQVILAVLLATLLGCSRLPAIVAVYITNPFTAVPIYLFCFIVGAGLLRPFGIVVDIEQVKMLLVRSKDMGLWQTAYSKLLDVFTLGWHAFAPLWLGCMVVGAAAAAVAYHISLRLVTGHRLIKAERMARRAKMRLERIQREQAMERAREGAGHG